MKKQIVVCATLLFALTVSAFAVPVDCTGLETLSEYIALSDGCFVQDKLFTNFSYTGGGAVTASNVHVDTVLSTVPGTDIHGFIFAPVSGLGVWTTGFSLGYTIAVNPPDPTVNITGASLQANFGVLANPSSAVSTKSIGPPLMVSAGDETDAAIFAGVQSLTSSTEVTIPAGWFVISLEENYIQSIGQQVVPEPGTSLLFMGGIGLLLLGRLARRKA